MHHIRLRSFVHTFVHSGVPSFAAMELAGASLMRSASNGVAAQCIAGPARVATSGNSSGSAVWRAQRRRHTRSVIVAAKIKKGKMTPEEDYPWPEKFPPGEITDNALKYLNRFKPLPNPQKPVTLPFERPIVELENKIDEVSFCFVIYLCFSPPSGSSLFHLRALPH